MHQWTYHKIANHNVISFGHPKGGNKCTGTAVAFSDKIGDISNVLSVSFPKGTAEGRRGAVRVCRGLFDVCVVTAYFPVKRSGKERLGFEAEVRGLIDWLQRLLDELPQRCVPLVGLDLNDRFGSAHRSHSGRRARTQVRTIPP